MLYGFLITIHVLVSFILVVVILLQSNNAGGAGGIFGGGSFQNIFGIKSPTVMAKFTAVCATVFILTSISLALVSARNSGSLVERAMGTHKAVPAAATANTTASAQEAAASAQKTQGQTVAQENAPSQEKGAQSAQDAGASTSVHTEDASEATTTAGK
jgi:preprotein translocase subunit SecG